MEKYEDIIKEIKELDKSEIPICEYVPKHDVNPDGRHVLTVSFGLDIAQRVRDAVGGDFREWYQLDKQGSRLYIGDQVLPDCTNVEYAVEGFDFEDGIPTAYLSGGARLFVDNVRKVHQDTQKQIDDDITLFPYEYCKKYDLFPIEEDNEDQESLMTRMVKHLLERQRKLCEVENA